MSTQETPPLTFGISLVQGGEWTELVTCVQGLEALGFDKVWFADHFVPPAYSETDFFECWTTLAGLAAVTTKIRLGPLVSSLTLRNPAVLARMAMTVDHISKGRLELGLGAGGADTCHTMTGVPQWDGRERAARFREFVEIVDQMLAQDVTTYDGQYYQIQEAHMHPQPVQRPHPPLNIAAHGPKGLRLAAQYGEAWNSFLPDKDDLTPVQSSDLVRRRVEMLSEFAVEAGRDPETIDRTFLFGWTSDRPFASLDAFYDAVGRYREAGIRDFTFLYVPGVEEVQRASSWGWNGQAIADDDLLQRIALDLIPALRRS